MIRMAASGGFVLVFSCVLLIAKADAQVEAKPGSECTEGSRWRKDCNWCSCNLGLRACTKRGCTPGKEPSNEPECEGESEWRRREIGNHKCSWCVCEDGKGICKPVTCSGSRDVAPSKPNKLGGNRPNEVGGSQNWPNDFNREEEQPNNFGGAENQPVAGGRPQNRPSDFGGAENQPVAAGRPQNRPSDFGGAENRPNAAGRPQNRSNDLGGAENPPRESGRPQNRPHEFGETNQPINFGRERGFGGDESRPSKPNELRRTENLRSEDYSNPERTGCTEGSQWREECNWCACTKGLDGGSCTRKACLPGHTYTEPECRGNSEWKRREGGECSWCVCEDGGATCNPISC